MTRHLTRCLVAGVVALLPIGGTLLTVAYLESAIYSSWPVGWFYFPGLGLASALVILYAVGLFVTTFLGRWIWRRVDRALHHLPILGGMYQTLKQILGYGAGEDAVFQRVVFVPSDDTGGVQLGLVTNRHADGRLAVFVPGSPNPTAGRLLWIAESKLTVVPCDVADALKSLVSVGKVDVDA